MAVLKGTDMSKTQDTIKIDGVEVYVMQPGDRIIKGPENKGRMLETVARVIMPWGTFVSASRAEAIRQSRKRKAPAKKAKKAKK